MSLHDSLTDQSCLGISLQGCLDRTPGYSQDPDLRNVEKDFMLNDYMEGVWGFIRTGWKRKMNEIFHNGSYVRTYRNDPSSKHREIGQSDGITGFQLMHLFPGKPSGAGGNLLGGFTYIVY